eukprot:SAG11_NODE_9625_length_895_cov_1.214824_2_plen_38_part_01
MIEDRLVHRALSARLYLDLDRLIFADNVDVAIQLCSPI